MVFQAEIQAKKISIELPPRVVSRFENTVVGQFYGHTHQDEFIVFYEPEENARATNVAFISPSVATWTNLNPSYRIFTSDSNTHVRHPSFSKGYKKEQVRQCFFWKPDPDCANLMFGTVYFRAWLVYE